MGSGWLLNPMTCPGQRSSHHKLRNRQAFLVRLVLLPFLLQRDSSPGLECKKEKQTPWRGSCHNTRTQSFRHLWLYFGFETARLLISNRVSTFWRKRTFNPFQRDLASCPAVLPSGLQEEGAPRGGLYWQVYTSPQGPLTPELCDPSSLRSIPLDVKQEQ